MKKVEDVKAVGGNALSEFKEFITRGNVLDLAVGVIMGGAVGKIVSSIVDDMLMPLIGSLLGGLDFSSLSVNINGAVIKYGAFIQNVVDFLIIALCLFVMIKIVGSFTKKKEEVVEEAPVKTDEAVLLEEIRDLLKKEK